MNECNDLINLMMASGAAWILLSIGLGIFAYRLNTKLREVTEDRDWWMKHSGGPRL